MSSENPSEPELVLNGIDEKGATPISDVKPPPDPPEEIRGPVPIPDVEPPTED